jgi:hypothetical protein
VFRQNGQHVLKRLFILAQNPVAVLAHHGKPIEDNCLSRRNHSALFALVEGAGQSEIDIVERQNRVLRIDFVPVGGTGR